MEDVAVNRQPLSKLEAIYFLSPEAESVDALIRDFDPEVKKRLMYAAVHIFFTSSAYLPRRAPLFPRWVGAGCPRSFR